MTRRSCFGLLVSSVAVVSSLTVACGSAGDPNFSSSSGGAPGAVGGGAGVPPVGGGAGSAATGGVGTGGSAGSDGGSDGSAGKGGASTGGKGGASTGGKGGASAGGSGGASAGGSGGASAGGSGGTSVGGSGGTSVGGSGGVSTGGAGGAGGACSDNGDEPNDSENAATSIAAVGCGGGSKTHDGVAATSTDVDWYTAKANGATLCGGDAVASVDQSSLRVCAYVRCVSGTTTRTCKHGIAATSPDGVDGCCSTGGSAEARISCSGLLNNQAATLFMRVDQPNGDACMPYRLTFSY